MELSVKVGFGLIFLALLILALLVLAFATGIIA